MPNNERELRSDEPRLLTPRERRRRWVLLAILILLLLLLSYAGYYFVQNRSLPAIKIRQPQAAIEPPEYLYSITGGDGANQLDRPVGVAVGPDGRVYVVDFGHQRVSVFTNTGRFLFSFNKTGAGVLRNPVHMVIRNNEVWVTDRRLRGIYIFDLEGKFKRVYTPKNEKLIWTPLALAFGADGKLAVTEVGMTDRHRLMVFSADASRTVTVGRTAQVKSLEEAPGAFLFPDGVAISRDGRIFVSDGDNRRIQVFKPTGEFDYFIDTSGVPRGVAIDNKSRLYVVDAIAHTIDVYNLKGKRLTQFGGQGFGPGQFNYPNDLTVDPRYHIYITDRENNQVQVWGWKVAQPPAVSAPSSPWGWALCLSPLLLLFVPLALRRIRIVVTSDFVDVLVAAGDIRAVSERRRLKLIAPEEHRALYAGRTADGVDLEQLIEFEAHSDSDMRALREKLECSEDDAILLAMASRVAALGTENRELRRLAVLADVRALTARQFLEKYFRR
jgi:sugar lactone lactonase YvrE